jgi:hypothetical protein
MLVASITMLEGRSVEKKCKLIESVSQADRTRGRARARRSNVCRFSTTRDNRVDMADCPDTSRAVRADPTQMSA